MRQPNYYKGHGCVTHEDHLVPCQTFSLLALPGTCVSVTPGHPAASSHEAPSAGPAAELLHAEHLLLHA